MGSLEYYAVCTIAVFVVVYIALQSVFWTKNKFQGKCSAYVHTRFMISSGSCACCLWVLTQPRFSSKITDGQWEIHFGLDGTKRNRTRSAFNVSILSFRLQQTHFLPAPANMKSNFVPISGNRRAAGISRNFRRHVDGWISVDFGASVAWHRNWLIRWYDVPSARWYCCADAAISNVFWDRDCERTNRVTDRNEGPQTTVDTNRCRHIHTNAWNETQSNIPNKSMFMLIQVDGRPHDIVFSAGLVVVVAVVVVRRTSEAEIWASRNVY